MALILLGVLGSGRALKWLKWRVTYPRTRYVAYPRPKGKAFLQRLALMAGVGAVVTLVLA